LTNKTSRPLPLRLVALAAFLLSLACAGMTASSEAGAAAPPPSFYGMSESGPDTTSASEWNRIETTGAKTVRLEFNWKRDFYGGASAVSCPSSPLPSGSISWTTIDNKVRLAALRGIEILPYLTGSFCSQGYPEPGSAEMTAWLSFVDDLGDRYGPGGTFWSGPSAPPVAVPIDTWEVGNEPNLPHNNPGGTLDPQKYGKFLIQTSGSVKTSQPAATVLLGGLTTPASGASSVSDYLDDLYNPNPLYSCCTYTAAQLNAAYDGLSLHPYAIASNGTATVNNITASRTALNGETSAFGADKPIWVTEFGWPVATNIVADCSSTATVTVNGYQQNQYLYQVLSWMTANHDLAANLKLGAWQSHVNTNAKCGTGPEVDPANYGDDYAKGKMGVMGPALFIQGHSPAYCMWVSYTSVTDCATGPWFGASPKMDMDPVTFNNLTAYRNYSGGISYCSYYAGFECKDLSNSDASGNPGVSQDPTTGATKIIYRRTNGQIGVWEKSSWSGSWSHSILGAAGDIASGTSPGVYRTGDSGTGTLITIVVYRGGGGELMFKAHLPSTGWLAATRLGTVLVSPDTSPTVTRSVIDGSTVIAFRDWSGKVGTATWTSVWGWTYGTLGSTGVVDAGASPAIARDPVSGAQVIAYRDSTDELEAFKLPSGSWTWTQVSSGSNVAADTNPTATVDETAGSVLVPFHNASDGLSTWTMNSAGTFGSPTALVPIDPTLVPLKLATGTDPVASIVHPSGGSPEYLIPYTNGSNTVLAQQLAYMNGVGGTWNVPIISP